MDLAPLSPEGVAELAEASVGEDENAINLPFLEFGVFLEIQRLWFARPPKKMRGSFE